MEALRFSQGDVVTQGSIEQQVFRENDSDLATQPGRVDQGQVFIEHERLKPRLVRTGHQALKARRAWFLFLPPYLRRTLTFDNGTEFAAHWKLGQVLGLKTYFCAPHSP